jgi:hypothetical protein
MVEKVGLPKIISDDFITNIPFLGNLSWNPADCGINPHGRVLYFLQFPQDEFLSQREQDVLWGLIIPIGDQDLLREFILRKLDLKSLSSEWSVKENTNPSFMSFHHKSAHVSLGMDDQCLVVLSSWWADQKDPDFLDVELTQVFNFGQSSSIASSSVGNKLTGDDYDVGLSILGKNFFESFCKNKDERVLYETFDEYLNFDLHLKAKAGIDKVSMDGAFEYEDEVLESGFGLKVASQLDKVRESEAAASLKSVYGEFLEIFTQRLDFQTAGDLIERIDLSSTSGFDQFDNLTVHQKIQNQRNGMISMSVDTTESGGQAICSLIDLLVAALNPFPENSP